MKGKYRREQENMTPVLVNTGTSTSQNKHFLSIKHIQDLFLRHFIYGRLSITAKTRLSKTL